MYTHELLIHILAILQFLIKINTYVQDGNTKCHEKLIFANKTNVNIIAIKTVQMYLPD